MYACKREIERESGERGSKERDGERETRVEHEVRPFVLRRTV